jgi:hypothetical protein
VWCASAADCIAVGDYGIDESHTRPLGERWNGSAWSVQTVPLPAGAVGGSLGGVSCVSATACVAVGDAFNPDNTASALAELWNGATWTAELIPGGLNVYLGAVSCTSASACMSVGEDFPPDATRFPMAALRKGTSWTLQRPPTPARSDTSDLAGVDCTAPAACVAVGSTHDRALGDLPLVERYG